MLWEQTENWLTKVGEKDGYFALELKHDSPNWCIAESESQSRALPKTEGVLARCGKMPSKGTTQFSWSPFQQ
jgi:hypothetical protein